MDMQKAERAVFDLLNALGEDVDRDGLRETPKRVAKMYAEIFSGTNVDPCGLLKFFDEGNCHSEIVTITDIPVHSVCEHHMLPFVGMANIAYMPKEGRIVGLSKVARIVDCFAKRLQVQERLTDQVAKFIYENANVNGVIVTIEAEHLCMTIRGIKAMGAKTKTAAFYGALKDNIQKRAEALALLK